MNEILRLPNGQELQIGKFALARTALVITGAPSYKEWQEAGGFLQKADGAVHWWIGDWLLYGHERYERGQYEEAVEATGFGKQTLANDRWVAGQIESSRRREDLTFAHHAEVAALPEPDQDEWLDKAEREGWSKQELRKQMQQRKPRVLPVPPDGIYRCIIIDPPWPMLKIPREAREKQTRTILDYPTQDLDEIEKLTVASLGADDGCHLYLWVTQRFLPAGLQFIKTWGYEYQCTMTWVKPTGMTPYSWMYNTEHVLFAHKGNLPVETKGLKLSFEAPVVKGTHSTKPDIFYERVVQASPEPRLEMFARRSREGFTVWGDEV